MISKVSSVLILTSLLVAAVALTTVSGADNAADARQDARADGPVSQYSFTAETKPASQASLGTFTADGGSPGHIIGRTYRDDQSQLSPGRFIDWRVGPQVHSVFSGQALPGHDDAGIARWIDYSMFDPTTAPDGVFLSMVWLQWNPLETGGWYPNLDIDETGHAVHTGEEFHPADPVRTSAVFWDFAGPGAWGTFIADQTPQAMSIDPGEYIAYPRIEYQEYNGQYTLHLLTLEDSGDPACDLDAVTYWQKSMSSASGGMSATWTTTLITDRVWANQFDIASARGGNGNVAIVWIEWPDYCNGIGATDGVIYAMTSSDAGATWGSPVIISDTTSPFVPWVDINSLYDTDGYLHVIYNASPTGGIDPSWIYHWSDRNPGPYGGGDISAVHVAEGLEHLCGRGQTNVALTAKPVISQCNDRLYVIWQQYGDPRTGDTLDCADPSLPNRYGPQYNADIWLTVSSSLDGLFWDRARNLTNSKSPGCDGTNEYNCDHDAFASMSRYGMNVADFGTTYWGAIPEAFEVRDALEPSYPDDGSYLDVQFTNDLMPEAARYMDDPDFEGIWWTYNPIKWFRLPCVAPVAGPCVYLQYDKFVAPRDWVKSGTETVIEDIPISSMCNEPLQISSIEVDMITGSEGAVTVPAWPTSIPAGGTDFFDIIINPGGLINPPQDTWEPIEADIIVHTNDPDAASFTRYHINTVIADTVVSIVWNTISTNNGYGVSLTVANNGNAGNTGVGNVNLDFVSTGDCDSTAKVYLNDLTPVIMTMPDEGHYSWQPYYDDNDPADCNFRPIDKDAISMNLYNAYGFDRYVTDVFVNSDSTIGCRKIWVAPDDDVSYMIERWEVFSFDGATHSNVALGEWIDWDIPSGRAGNDGGFIVDPTGPDYVWQQGRVDDAPEEPPCLDGDSRYGASGLLGYYYSSEFVADHSVNHSMLEGGFVLRDYDIFGESSVNFEPDSAWAYLHRSSFEVNQGDEDKQILLSFGTHDILPDDALVINIIHASIYGGDENDVQAVIDEAETWYLAYRDEFDHFSCCGLYTGGWAGNANCSIDGKITLADLTRLIDRVYVSKEPLCCEESGNTDRDPEGRITLTDITALIDAIYISKCGYPPCLSAIPYGAPVPRCR